MLIKVKLGKYKFNYFISQVYILIPGGQEN
jgi:hypothetical protein